MIEDCRQITGRVITLDLLQPKNREAPLATNFLPCAIITAAVTIRCDQAGRGERFIVQGGDCALC